MLKKITSPALIRNPKKGVYSVIVNFKAIITCSTWEVARKYTKMINKRFTFYIPENRTYSKRWRKYESNAR
jgi:hypothetical protein